ncbi:GntR family transcriptional regulator [Azohydromonas caseinilytica]|uniref:GntR family transcriptional regulator n=1 Tax=Azohydromonas caseinilytica TaxID=2728836 RepID=A0A848FDR2_9BURK|nr:GntR family transcriptional regulator [Azohydromonas caseinilytica]NML17146.1 GntR family transcriptional regulator [Azohydromonas caseinilytica]
MKNPSPPTPPGGIVPVVAGRVLELLTTGGYAVGDRITEQSLADALGVSRSPVRKALQYLEALGALSSSPNRGFQVAQDAKRLRKIQITDEESDEAIYMRIVEDRLTEAIDEEVSEAELMERHGLTRLQVQRVLNRMAREGLAERKPGRGWLFRAVLNTVDSHRESYRFRMIIEPAAILEPTFRVDRALFDKVRHQQQMLLDGGIERWTAAERFRAGAEFHEAIVACANNRFLLDALRNVNQQRRIIEYHCQTNSAADRERMRRQCEEHLALLDLLEAGERMEASHRLRQHLDVVRAIKTEDKAPATPQKRTRGKDLAVEIHL